MDQLLADFLLKNAKPILTFIGLVVVLGFLSGAGRLFLALWPWIARRLFGTEHPSRRRSDEDLAAIRSALEAQGRTLAILAEVQRKDTENDERFVAAFEKHNELTSTVIQQVSTTSLLLQQVHRKVVG